MKKQFWQIALILLSLSLLLASCSGDESKESEPDTPAPSAEETEAIQESAKILPLTGENAYRLIRPDSITDQRELDAALTIFNTLKDRMDTRPTFETDFVKKNADPDAVYDYEILIGMTNRTATKTAYDLLAEGEFLIGMIGTRLVCVGYTPELTAIAAEIFIEQYVNEDGITVREDFMDHYQAEATYDSTVTFTNPVRETGADPWVIRDEEDGTYYYCTSAGNGVNVSPLDGLFTFQSTAAARTVYTAPEGTNYSAEYWAPELHKINGKWYIYVAADDGNNVNHRMYVLECLDAKPTGRWQMVGQITDSTDKWAIDGTVLQYQGELYFIWSGWEGDNNVSQYIYIAHMSSPTEIDGERVLLSQPEFGWERVGDPNVNEGPVALIKDDTVHIVYSASGSWTDDYCLGMLTFRGGDILDPASWTKSKDPVFSKGNGIFGPGHCSFTTTDDGAVWMIYHGNTESGTGWGGRKVWIAPVDWDGDTPLFGTPQIGEIKVPARGYTKESVTKK